VTAEEYREDLRSEARERALGLLYESEAKSLAMAEVLAALPVTPDPLAVLLAKGVAEHRTELDELISRYARGWAVERMANIDRMVMEIAAFELCHRADVPLAVVLDEAVELAKRFSTDDSPRFVNGVLAAIARDVRPEGR
jgi:transcription antitermination protein NusB